MDIRIQSLLVAAIVATALGLAALLRGEKSRTQTYFGLFSTATAIYYLIEFLASVVATEKHGILWPSRIGIIAGACVPLAGVAFYLEFLGLRRARATVARRLSWFALLAATVVAITPLATYLYARIAVGALVIVTLGVPVLLLRSRMAQTTLRVERLRLLYLTVGSGASVFFSALDLLTGLGLPLPSLGPLVTILNLYLLSQTISSLRLMDLHELLGKIAAQFILAAILSVVFTLLTVWWRTNTPLFLFNTFVAALVLTILLNPLSSWVGSRVVALAFRQRFAFLEQIRDIIQRSAHTIEVTELVTMVLDGLNETRRITHASIYVLSNDRPGFRLLDFRGPAPAAFLEPRQSRSLLLRPERAQLIETVERRIGSLNEQPSEARRQREELRRLKDAKGAMELMQAGLTAPLFGGDRVLGFFNLLDERVPEAFASDEIAAILELSELIARTLENSTLYDKLRERDRLAALGEMAAGLAHEIRNPLGGIKGAAQCLDPSALPKEDRELVSIITEEVDRLNGVVTAFLDYARPLKQSFGPTDINEVIGRTLLLLAKTIPESITVVTELAERLPKVEGDPEQLRQVLINLIQNAVQAFEGKPGVITISSTRPEHLLQFRATDLVELTVKDDGPGIPLEQHPNMFVPFFTTKQKGTGLGLAICQRIVRNHGGSIALVSRPNEGSTFIVRLPAIPMENAEEESVASFPSLPQLRVASRRRRR